MLLLLLLLVAFLLIFALWLLLSIYLRFVCCLPSLCLLLVVVVDCSCSGGRSKKKAAPGNRGVHRKLENRWLFIDGDHAMAFAFDWLWGSCSRQIEACRFIFAADQKLVSQKKNAQPSSQPTPLQAIKRLGQLPTSSPVKEGRVAEEQEVPAGHRLQRRRRVSTKRRRSRLTIRCCCRCCCGAKLPSSWRLATAERRSKRSSSPCKSGGLCPEEMKAERQTRDRADVGECRLAILADRQGDNSCCCCACDDDR